MDTSDQSAARVAAAALDRPNTAMPSVDQPWASAAEQARLMTVRRGDLATHRAYHSLYEDMLN